MITEFGGLSKALGGSAGNLFATVANLQPFTSMLKTNNGQVKLAEQQLAEVSGVPGRRPAGPSAARSSELAIALARSSHSSASNRGLLMANISKLAAITSLLVQRAGVAGRGAGRRAAGRGQPASTRTTRRTIRWTAAATSTS